MTCTNLVQPCPAHGYREAPKGHCHTHGLFMCPGCSIPYTPEEEFVDPKPVKVRRETYRVTPSPDTEKKLCPVEGCTNTRKSSGINQFGEKKYRGKCQKHRGSNATPQPVEEKFGQPDTKGDSIGALEKLLAMNKDHQDTEEDWEKDIDNMLDGMIVDERLAEKYPILRVGEAVIHPDKIKDFIKRKKAEWERDAQLKLAEEQKAGNIPYFNMHMEQARTKTLEEVRWLIHEELNGLDEEDPRYMSLDGLLRRLDTLSSKSE